MGLPALTSTKYIIRGNGQIENKNKRHSIFVWVSFILKIIYHTKAQQA